MHRITISSGPCGNLVSTKWGVSELEVDNMFYWGKETHSGLRFQDSGKKVRVRVRTLDSLHLIQSRSSCFFLILIFILPSVCILPLVRSLQSAFYPWSAVCILPSVCILLSLNFSRLLLSLVSRDRRLKALGDNAVRWRHESNVVIYEISHATFGADS